MLPRVFLRSSQGFGISESSFREEDDPSVVVLATERAHVLVERVHLFLTLLLCFRLRELRESFRVYVLMICYENSLRVCFRQAQCRLRDEEMPVHEPTETDRVEFESTESVNQPQTL